MVHLLKFLLLNVSLRRAFFTLKNLCVYVCVWGGGGSLQHLARDVPWSCVGCSYKVVVGPFDNVTWGSEGFFDFGVGWEEEKRKKKTGEREREREDLDRLREGI